MVTPAETKEQGGKVLIIDDERGPRESLRILLKTNYDVYCADCVQDGLKLLQENLPDIVIMDIRMPGKSGIEGLREVRAIDPLVSVVMLTGYGSLETAQQALRLGATDYLNKPFDAHELRDAANGRKDDLFDRNIIIHRSKTVAEFM